MLILISTRRGHHGQGTKPVIARDSQLMSFSHFDLSEQYLAPKYCNYFQDFFSTVLSTKS